MDRRTFAECGEKRRRTFPSQIRKWVKAIDQGRKERNGPIEDARPQGRNGQDRTLLCSTKRCPKQCKDVKTTITGVRNSARRINSVACTSGKNDHGVQRAPARLVSRDALQDRRAFAAATVVNGKGDREKKNNRSSMVVSEM